MISCNQYDYVEIACLYRLPLLLTFKNGSSIEGVAKDTLHNKDKKECLLIVQEGDKELIVILDHLKSMQVTIENPHFSTVEFDN